jgi:hypothetical protein
MKPQLLLLASFLGVTSAYHININEKRQANSTAPKACNASSRCAAGEFCYNTKTQSSAEGVCIGTTCTSSASCPTGQYCGKRLIGDAGLYGEDGPVFSSVSRCLDLTLACGEDKVFPTCGCPTGLECVEGNWNRTGTAAETIMDYQFCAPKGTGWGTPTCVKYRTNEAESCNLVTPTNGQKVCVIKPGEWGSTLPV